MGKTDIVDKLFEIQEICKEEKLTFADIKYKYLVFVRPGEKITNSLHIAFPVFPEKPDCAEYHLKLFRRIRTDIPEGNVAVFIYDNDYCTYHYYKTIKHRRKSFDLSCDSE